MYFNIGRIAYLQANVLSAYVFLAPAIVAGVVTLGVMQQLTCCSSRQYAILAQAVAIIGQVCINVLNWTSNTTINIHMGNKQ